jgi:hypothetical protein
MFRHHQLTPTRVERIQLEDKVTYHPFVSALYGEPASQPPAGLHKKTNEKTSNVARKIFPLGEPKTRSVYSPIEMLQCSDGPQVVANPTPLFDSSKTQTQAVHCRFWPKSYQHHERLAELQAEIEVLTYLADKCANKVAAARRYYIAIQFGHLREYLFNLHHGELSGRSLGVHLGLKHTRVIEQKKEVNNNKYILDLAENHNKALRIEVPQRKKGQLF